jgi:5-hydroxyisourate hydrolase-like protein (transthyretin family)
MTASVATTATLTAAHGTVAAKAKDALTGVLKAGVMPLGGQKVSLMKRAAGAKTWTLVSTKTTDTKGTARVTVVPGTKKGHEQYELVYKGGKAGATTYEASHSSVITVTIS